MSRFLPRILGGSGGAQERVVVPDVDWYPGWLGHRLIKDDLPWDAAQSTTLSAFLELYSLHDSSWHALWITPGQGLVGIIRWSIGRLNLNDPEWVAFEKQVGPMPVLLMCFPHLYRFDQEAWADADDPFLYLTIIGADSRQVPEDELEQMLWRSGAEREHERQEPVCESTFYGIERYSLRLLHSSRIAVLLFNDRGTQVPIPRL
jgi:hypothetical protein